MYFASFGNFLNNFSTAISVLVATVLFVGGTYTIRLRLIAAKKESEVDEKENAYRALEESNKAMVQLHYTDQLQLTQKDKEIGLLKKTNETLQFNNTSLENIKTQAPSIIALMENTSKQHQEIMGAFAKMTRELGNVAKALTKKERNHGKK